MKNDKFIPLEKVAKAFEVEKRKTGKVLVQYVNGVTGRVIKWKVYSRMPANLRCFIRVYSQPSDNSGLIFEKTF